MNVLEGLMMQGLTLNTEDNFNSVPGLKLWLDARERVTKDGSGLVSLWNDKSSQINNVFQNRSTSKPTSVNDLWIESNPTLVLGEALQSNRKDYRFMHNGSAFGFYTIIKMNLSTAGCAPIATRLSNTGFRFFLSANSNGRVVIDVYNGGVIVRQVLLTGILNTYSGTAIVILKHVFKGVGVANNHIIQYGDIIRVDTHTATGYANTDSDVFYVSSNANVGQSLFTGLSLLYDWTGQSSLAIDNFDATIMGQLQNERLIFQNLDAA